MRVEKTDEYRDLLDGLKDCIGRAQILVCIDRLIDGNPGQHRDLTEGVSETKLMQVRATAFTTRSVKRDFYCC